MLYTIVPEEVVLQGLEDVAACEEISFKGRRLMVRPMGSGQLEVIQLVSSDPADFLDPELQPGRVLERGYALIGSC